MAWIRFMLVISSTITERAWNTGTAQRAGGIFTLIGIRAGAIIQNRRGRKP